MDGSASAPKARHWTVTLKSELLQYREGFMLFNEDLKAAWGLATAAQSAGSGALWRSLQRRHVVTTSVDVVKVRSCGVAAHRQPTRQRVPLHLRDPLGQAADRVNA